MRSKRRWLGERLNMGPPEAVCRYISEALSGRRPQACDYLNTLVYYLTILV